MTTAADIVQAARSQMGVRWQHHGRTERGRDCIGLVLYAAHSLALSEFDTRDYPRFATDETMLTLCREHMDPVELTAMQPGDIPVFAFDSQRHIGVLGDYVFGGLSLIHAHAINRKVVEHRLDDIWRRRIIGCFRFRGVV
jgi:cell wall-associated NlpC family hydrolase